MRDASPLRYPGGKWRVAPYFERLILLNGLSHCHYFEAYAGGASLALSLLLRERVSEIHLNDLDPAIANFWQAVLTRNRDLVEMIRTADITPEEWRNQRTIYNKGVAAGKLALGFATLFLNRTNHSGIMNGGMIGGKAQNGEWRLDARFNKSELVKRIKRIGSFRNRIHISHLDAIEFLQGSRLAGNSLVYLDPPYYKSGRDLYLNAYRPEDHASVREHVRKIPTPWVVSYDDVPEIRRLYHGEKSRQLQLLHTARSSRVGREVLFFARGLRIPARLRG